MITKNVGNIEYVKVGNLPEIIFENNSKQNKMMSTSVLFVYIL